MATEKAVAIPALGRVVKIAGEAYMVVEHASPADLLPTAVLLLGLVRDGRLHVGAVLETGEVVLALRRRAR